MQHHVFDYRTIQELERDIQSAGLMIPSSNHLEVLGRPLLIEGKTVSNRLTAQPIEGFDALPDGSPSPRNKERYLRYAAGMSGMIWLESVSVTRNGRSNPYQLWLTEENAQKFAELRLAIDAAGNEQGVNPFTVIQLTHSGRYSGPDGIPRPVCAFRNPCIPKEGERVISDEELEVLEEDYVRSALLAEKSGFDAVDIRACHGYLINELLGAYSREGRFGGCFENRSRFLLDVVRKIKQQSSSLVIAVRLNFYDGLPYPFGWGCDQINGEPSFDEPLRLVQLLFDSGVRLFNVSAGIGAYSPQIIRPSDGGGEQMKQEHPLEGIARQLSFARAVKQAVPGAAVIASAFSWLREYGANVAAGGIESGWFDCAGFGRQAIAYPAYARDILLEGGMKRSECCTTCNGCMALIKKKGQPMRCVIKEKE